MNLLEFGIGDVARTLKLRWSSTIFVGNGWLMFFLVWRF